MMQKFGFNSRQRECASTLDKTGPIGKYRMEETKMERNTENAKNDQPKTYYYQMVPNEQNEEIFLHQEVTAGFARRTSMEKRPIMGKRLNSFMEKMPFSRDSCSDTDSGICTDNGSDCQQSPKYPITAGSVSPPSVRTATDLHRSAGTVQKGCQPAIAILPPPSNFKFRHQPAHRNVAASSSLPQAQSTLPTRRGKAPMKVRFADEVINENDGQCSSTVPTNDHYYSIPPLVPRQSSPPPLPDYEMAMRRMRTMGQRQRSASLPRRPDQTGQVEQELRICHNSHYQQEEDYEDERAVVTMPRNCGAEKRLSEAKSMENLSSDGWADRGYFKTTVPFPIHKSMAPSKSCENLDETGGKCGLVASASNPVSIVQTAMRVTRIPPHQPRNRPRFSHCMSSALQKIADNALQKDWRMEENGETSGISSGQARSAHGKGVVQALGTLRRPVNKQTIPVNTTPASESQLAKYHNQGEPLCTDRLIEVRLLGLDHQGIQLIELRKTDDGPFGFYIATGSFKKKKGIFISRITVRGLFPLLSVGDQILDVDFQPVKGRILEEVQRMMSNTDRVILRTLPAIMR